MEYVSQCPTCGRERKYKTKNGYIKGINKNCKSCANSIKVGGKGYTKFCECGNLKYEKSSTYCKECHIKKSNAYHVQTYRFKQYGITREWYEEEIKYGCRICGKELNAYSKIKRERCHIDHDHKTGKVRGILCDLCNKGLGQFSDSIEKLQNAIKYLQENNNKNG